MRRSLRFKRPSVGVRHDSSVYFARVIQSACAWTAALLPWQQKRTAVRHGLLTLNGVCSSALVCKCILDLYVINRIAYGLVILLQLYWQSVHEFS